MAGLSESICVHFRRSSSVPDWMGSCDLKLMQALLPDASRAQLRSSWNVLLMKRHITIAWADGFPVGLTDLAVAPNIQMASNGPLGSEDAC